MLQRRSLDFDRHISCTCIFPTSRNSISYLHMLSLPGWFVIGGGGGLVRGPHRSYCVYKNKLKLPSDLLLFHKQSGPPDNTNGSHSPGVQAPLTLCYSNSIFFWNPSFGPLSLLMIDGTVSLVLHYLRLTRTLFHQTLAFAGYWRRHGERRLTVSMNPYLVSCLRGGIADRHYQTAARLMNRSCVV